MTKRDKEDAEDLKEALKHLDEAKMLVRRVRSNFNVWGIKVMKEHIKVEERERKLV